jgi:O-antigen ligase
MAQCTLLGIGIWLLHEAHSATSGTCFTLSAGLLLLTNLRRIRGRPGAVRAVVLTVVLIGALIKLTGFDDLVLQIIGRNPDLTGRADFWPLLIPMNPNALVGSGWESFWTGPRMHRIWLMFPNAYINESHNGYIEVYLNLGLIGLGLLIAMFVRGFRQSLAALRTYPDLGSLMLVYMLTALLYSYTEAGFRMLFFPWSFLILAMLTVSAISRTSRKNTVTTAVQTPSILASR